MPRAPRSGPRHQLDIAVHKLWRRHPDALVRLATGFEELRVRELLPERISSVRREADGAALVDGPHGPFVAHLEFHGDTSPGRIARQMYVTGALLYARHEGAYPVLSTAVLLDRRSSLEGQLQLQYGSRRLMDLCFRVLRLYEVPSSELASRAELAPLCALGAGAALEDVAQAGAVIQASAASEDDILEALAILYVVSGRRFDADSLDRLPWRHELMQSSTPIISSTFMKIYNMGREAGAIEAEARILRRSLRRQLQRRFGALPVWAEEKLEAAPLAQLDTWMDAAALVATLQDLFGQDLSRE